MGKSNASSDDVFKRINFLYQAAYQCLKTNDFNLCRLYIHMLKTITRRQVLHLHPNMKRTMCRRCCVLLVPGLTAKVRTKSKREKHTVVTCLDCRTIRRYVFKPEFLPWVDRVDAWNDQVVNGQMVNRQKNKDTGQHKGQSSKQRPQTSNKDTQKASGHQPTKTCIDSKIKEQGPQINGSMINNSCKETQKNLCEVSRNSSQEGKNNSKSKRLQTFEGMPQKNKQACTNHDQRSPSTKIQPKNDSQITDYNHQTPQSSNEDKHKHRQEHRKYHPEPRSCHPRQFNQQRPPNMYSDHSRPPYHVRNPWPRDNRPFCQGANQQPFNTYHPRPHHYQHNVRQSSHSFHNTDAVFQNDNRYAPVHKYNN